MFSKVLVANRGEIAVRVMRTCRRMGIATVAVYAANDAEALHVRTADEAVALGDGPVSDTYLDIGALIAAAERTGAEAVHPGYGFLAENADFAEAVAAAGLVFIGPPPQAIRTMGEKVSARAVARAAGVPLAPGTDGAVESVDELLAFGAEHGYPVMVKAAAGGGGRGMRIVASADEAADALAAAGREAKAAFGNGAVYVERYLDRARHVEVQVFADSHGNTAWVGDRDCTVQRRHQKLVEEAPAPGLPEETRIAMGEAAVRLAEQVGYRGAGTVEFLVEEGAFHFLEMNTRIQVEHPVTELVQGVDLVAEQLAVAAGAKLSLSSGYPPQGVAVEARINAEDVADGAFLPSPGRIERLQVPTADWLRFDTGHESGDVVQPDYDSLIGKLIAHGADREEAIRRLDEALAQVEIEGVSTTIPAIRAVLAHQDFARVAHTTHWLEEIDLTGDGPADRQEVEVAGRWYTIPFFSPAGPAGVPAVAGIPGAPATNGGEPARRSGRTGKRARQAASSDGSVTASMQGTIVKIAATAGQRVDAGTLLFVLEAMKMENPVKAPCAGEVGEVTVQVGDTVASGTLLTTIAQEA